MQNNNSIYLNKRNELFDKIIKNRQTTKASQSHQFTLVSANVLKFLPEVPFEKHEEIYNEIILHNSLTHFEQLHQEALDYVTTDNFSPAYLELLKTKPCVLSSFHFGTYRLFNTFLVKNNIPFTIVGPKSILEREKETFKKMYANGNYTEEYRFIELESPALGLKMLRELKNGRSVFIYFDGHRGIGSRNESEGNIEFLNEQIMARKGVAYLANAANVPLITAIAYRKSIDDIRLHFFDPVFPDKNVSKDEFAHTATQLIYDRFTPFLRQYPGQWEAWLYLHKSIDHTHNSEKSVQGEELTKFKERRCADKYSFNPMRYGLFKIKEESFLFNKQLYKTYPIDSSTYDILEKSTQGFIGKKDITNNYLFTQFFDNRVLLAV